ncbi:putative pantothenate transporter [Aspergillus ambiguus]|uniref:putative pantothenate transporter n=1 Tax=Aspergillus ambiguus TaxID=176160 RepID=UPI003CCD6F31
MGYHEKKLLLKLDLLILPYGCLSYFTKFLDQQSITNTYVTGMREDLGLTGNELNYLDLVFLLGYVIPMIPISYFITRARINIALPSLELGWGLCTFGCAWAQNVDTLYALRVLTGVFESGCWTGVVYVIGSWYKPHEIARRIALFMIAAPIGTMCSGFLETATFEGLNNAYGLEGWRWLFIVCTIITIPVSLLGFLAFPDTPHSKKPRFLSRDESILAKDRIDKTTAPKQLILSRGLLKRLMAGWQAQISKVIVTPFSLYLKETPTVYSPEQVNMLPNIAHAVTLVSTLLAGIIADKTQNYSLLSILCTIPPLIGSTLLVIWDITEAGRLLGFILPSTIVAHTVLCSSWATLSMLEDAECRILLISIMNSVSQGMVAWISVLLFPAVKAPRFSNGFITTLVLAVLLLFVICLITVLRNRERQRQAISDTDGAD